MDSATLTLPEELTSNGHLFRVDSRGKYIPSLTSKSKGGIFYYELSRELANRILPNGKKVHEQVVNLETTDYEKAIERAKALVMERKEMSVRKVNVLNSADLITESVRNADPDGGSARRVWDRYCKSDTYLKKAEISKKNAASTFSIIEKYVGEKSLYDFGVEEASAFVSEMLKTYAVSSVRKVYIPLYKEIWNVAMPLIKNPWYDCAKWDEMRQRLAVGGTGAKITPEMSLSAFSEEYFRREAASGRKWEKNTEGFMRHFIKHMGVKTIKEVTQKVAMEYARRMVEDPEVFVNRRGRDRISKFHTMWAMLLPDVENPWENVCYDVSVMEFPKDEVVNTVEKTVENNCYGMPEIGFASSSECYRCDSPERLWAEYVARHSMKDKRAMTSKAMFMRLWSKTGFTSPKQITSAVAENYCEEVKNSKKSFYDDLIVLRMVWDTILPGVKNPWPISISRRAGFTFAGNRRKFDHSRFEKTDEPKDESSAVKEESPKADEAVPETLPDEQQSVAENATIETVTDCHALETEDKAEINPVRSGTESEKISFDEMYGIWESKTQGMYKKTTYVGYKAKLMRFAGWMLGRGVSEVGPGDVEAETARAYYEWVGNKVQYPLNDVSVLGIMWSAAFPKDRAKNPWKALYAEVTAAQPVLKKASLASRVWNWLKGLFRR